MRRLPAAIDIRYLTEEIEDMKLTDFGGPMNALHPQFMTDADGNRVSVVLPMDEFEALLDDLEDLRDALTVRDEPTVPWESVRAELGLE
jgi:hypothetical protein